VSPDTTRFLMPDRKQSSLVAEELQGLARLTLAGPAMGSELASAVEREIARRREDLARGTGSGTA
jgi:hypothetical protein